MSLVSVSCISQDTDVSIMTRAGGLTSDIELVSSRSQKRQWLASEACAAERGLL